MTVGALTTAQCGDARATRMTSAPGAVRPMSPTAAEYRALFGWPVVIDRGRVLLSMERGMVGVRVPAHIGPAVSDVLHLADADGPTLVESGSVGWTFLADPNSLVVAADELPSGVVVLHCPAQVPIPSADVPSGNTRWATPPDPGRRWLPTLAAVICAIRSTPWPRPVRVPTLSLPAAR